MLPSAKSERKRWQDSGMLKPTRILVLQKQFRMKNVVLAARILLGIAFLFFGANILVPFLHMKPQAPSDAVTFGTILQTHHYMAFVGLLQVIGGLLCLVGRFVPLGLTLLAPVLVNILLFHFTLEGGSGAVPGIILTVLELFLLFVYRRSFAGLFDAAPETF
jgi:putative oxidoreductase